MQKKLTALLILFIAIFTLAGCAEGGYSVSIYSDGRINESFYIELNQSAIELAGYDYIEVQSEILGAFESVRNNLLNTFNLANNGLNPVEKSIIRQGIRLPSIENNIIGVSFLFDSYENYKLFYDIQDDGEEPDNEVVENKIFYIKTTTTTSTAFKDADTSTLATNLLNYFSNPDNGNLTFTTKDVNFTYSYATSFTKLKSNADHTYITSGGLKVHEWNIPSDNYNIEIEFYEYTIVSTGWYILALSLTALFTTSLFVYHKFNEHKQNKILKLAKNDLNKTEIKDETNNIEQ